MNKKSLRFCLCLTVIAGTGMIAQSCGLFSKQQEVASRPKQQPVAWEVRKNRMTPPLYLMAHQYPNVKSYLPHGRVFISLLRKADSILIPYDQPEPRIHRKIATTTSMEGGLVIDSLISSTARKRLRSVLDQVQRVSYADIQTAPPLAVAELLVPVLRDASQNPTYVKKVWKQQNKYYRSVSGVLSVSSARNRYQQIGYQQQGKGLEQVLTNQQSVRRGLYKMSNAYGIPNYQAVWTARSKAYPFLDANEEVLISPVTQKWLQAIQERPGSAPVLALVGAEQLKGSEGLVKQLKNAGYKVQPYQVSKLKVPKPDTTTN